MAREWDVDAIVVGGGPAGSAAAAMLARAGRSVVVVERSRFPRYHVGESLLPYAWWTLDRIGALDKVRAAGFQSKRSVSFVTADGMQSRPFHFTEHLDHEAASTWQVERSVFDRLLLDHAAEQGAVVLSETLATGLIEQDGRVVGITARGPDGDHVVRAPWTIDASGRDGFVRTLRGWRQPEKALDRISLWTYYEGVELSDELASATTIVQAPGDGWFWFIPMAGGVTSVGIVARRDVLFGGERDKAKAWEAAIARHPWLSERLAGARCVGSLDVTTDYSYRSTYCADDGVVLAGDAFAFLDPVFSSGVFLALRTGEEAAAGVLAALDAGRVDAGAFEAYGEWVCRGIEAMRALVFSFYDPGFSMGTMVRAHPELKGDVTDVLIGNLFRDFDALMKGLGTFGAVPAPLAYGRARAGDRRVDVA
ncbi:MAG: tryptophan 7-halogenase [Alphaproteobacteria bacterium]|nr:tryptophan 7-halogenase [Alphaproteobacteria bacterium]